MKRYMQKGFTLIELMIVVAIIGTWLRWLCLLYKTTPSVPKTRKSFWRRPVAVLPSQRLSSRHPFPCQALMLGLASRLFLLRGNKKVYCH
ncbi:prepilin-type N-terminal cleavage/methylation domain-containing protein [Candidatus Aalborgicola defluviihabitans]|uniref:prepilin-type N-terminal cleavage/methylation domain-containing protein n=1 Tax=Candidatus Aalborgicola defluviihabitans TaxID=3386187 RepID=UPI0039B84A97